MFTRGGLLLLCVGILSACASIPTGPRVLVLPAVGKPMDVFQADEGACRSYAQQQIGGVPEQTPAQSTAAGVASAMPLQERYDMAYIQCMYAKGNVVPGVLVAPGPSYAPPPPGTPPPPPDTPQR